MIEVNDIVKMRDGTLVRVDEIASQDPEDYRWYAEDGETINAELPVETIFIGTAVRINLVVPYNVSKELGKVVSDISEIFEVVG